MDRMTFIEVAPDHWLRVDQIGSVQPFNQGFLDTEFRSRIYEIRTGYIDSPLTVDEVMERIREAGEAASGG